MLTSITDRILDDGTDRPRWLKARDWRIGASDAAKLSKLTSVDSYFDAKVKPGSFGGNEKTESGNQWEPLMLAWAGIDANKALIHAPGNSTFVATPDGLGTRDGILTLAECKAKHERIVHGPNTGEWRQLAWQMLCIPEAEAVEFIWVELIRDNAGKYQIRGANNEEPKSLLIPRGDPKLIQVTAQILPIATELAARLDAAREFEKEAA